MAVGGYSIDIVGIVPEGDPADVSVTEVTRPKVPVLFEPASPSLVPIVQIAVAPEPPEIVIVGAGALPLPYPPPELVRVIPVIVYVGPAAVEY